MLPFAQYLILVLVLVLSTTTSAWAACRCADLQKLCSAQPAKAFLQSKQQRCSVKAYQKCGIKPQLDIILNLDKKWENRNQPITDSINQNLSNSAKRKTLQFAQTLSDYKKEVLELYKGKISSKDYDKLAIAAVGILGAESSFYQSPRYTIKRYMPDPFRRATKCVVRGNCLYSNFSFYKCMYNKTGDSSVKAALFLCLNQNVKDSRVLEPLSNGPTQIKIISKKAAEHFNITPRSLFRNPSHAALATMAHLIEQKSDAFGLKKSRKKKMKSLTKNNFVDHLIYFYQGKGRRIVKGEVPSAKKNDYLKRFHKALKILRVRTHSCHSSKNYQAMESDL